MLHDGTLIELNSISTPITFVKDEYICYEGQPGNEMYIILKGSVGVYITNAIGAMTEVSRIMAGDFFGEMAIFDNLPRSASCIALEDTICVSISKKNLTRFFMNCPEIAGKVLENMSDRIRHLDNELYKTEHSAKTLHEPKFVFPEAYSFSHVVESPVVAPDCIYNHNEVCPVCGEKFTVQNLRKSVMRVRKIDPDRRVRYAEGDPIWFEVIRCPHCNYSNHHLSFFRITSFEIESVQKILKEQHAPVIEDKKFLTTPFDKLVLKYLQAIHINESVNASDNMLIGSLWLDLYWLACDAADDKLARCFARNAADKLQKAITEGKIDDAAVKCSLALTVAHLMAKIGRTAEASEFCDIASDSTDGAVKKQAYTLKDNLDGAYRN